MADTPGKDLEPSLQHAFKEWQRRTKSQKSSVGRNSSSQGRNDGRMTRLVYVGLAVAVLAIALIVTARITIAPFFRRQELTDSLSGSRSNTNAGPDNRLDSSPGDEPAGSYWHQPGRDATRRQCSEPFLVNANVGPLNLTKPPDWAIPPSLGGLVISRGRHTLSTDTLARVLESLSRVIEAEQTYKAQTVVKLYNLKHWAECHCFKIPVDDLGEELSIQIHKLTVPPPVQSLQEATSRAKLHVSALILMLQEVASSSSRVLAKQQIQAKDSKTQARDDEEGAETDDGTRLANIWSRLKRTTKTNPNSDNRNKRREINSITDINDAGRYAPTGGLFTLIARKLLPWVYTRDRNHGRDPEAAHAHMLWAVLLPWWDWLVRVESSAHDAKRCVWDTIWQREITNMLELWEVFSKEETAAIVEDADHATKGVKDEAASYQYHLHDSANPASSTAGEARAMSGHSSQKHHLEHREHHQRLHEQKRKTKQQGICTDLAELAGRVFVQAKVKHDV